MKISDELRLLCACVTWSRAGRSSEEISRLASRVSDWDEFAALALRHRMEGFAAACLLAENVTMPIPTATKLKQAAENIARANLLALAELVRLLAAFRRAGIAVLNLKGQPLSMLVYGDIARRHSKDIDLLVRQQDFARAGTVLEAQGYRRTMPRVECSDAMLNFWLRHRKDFAYRRGRSEVELHCRVADNPLFYSLPWNPKSWTPVRLAPDIAVASPAQDDLFLYLCIHGAHSGWHRLKWVADVAALLEACDESDILRLYGKAKVEGLERPVGQALALCARLFGTWLPPSVREELRSNRIVRILEWVALRRLCAGGVREPTAIPFGTLLTAPSRLLMRKGLAFKAKEISTSLNDPIEIVETSFPEAFLALTPVIRPFLWVANQLRRRKRHAVAAP